jgi:hypothetical protein
MWISATSGDYKLHTTVGTLEDLEAEAAKIRGEYEKVMDKISKVKGLERKFFALDRDLSAMTMVEELRAKRRRTGV